MNAWYPALDVVKNCLKAGVCEFVVCAGARNAALLEVLARAEAAGLVRVWRHFEERSAGFFALGRTMETSQPCAVITTSGTAAAELLPSIIEAHYQARPLVAITADRPAEFRGTGAPQAIVQPGIYGEYAWQGSFEDWDGKQPLHLNAEFEEAFEAGDETLTDETVGTFTPAKDRLDVAALARWLREETYQGLVVLIGGLEPDEREEVFHFCQDLGAPLIAKATSGLREAFAIARHPRWRPRSENPARRGKSCARCGAEGSLLAGGFEHLTEISVGPSAATACPGWLGSRGSGGSLERVLPALGEIELADDALDYLSSAGSRAVKIDELLEAYPDSEPALLRTLSHYASIGGGLFLGNSMPIREWNLFAQWQRPVPSVRANRGANGIDGQVSTWLGWSADVSETWAVVGDLTALYDLAAPFVLEQIDTAGRVLVVINNGGGKIFERLPRLQSMSPRAVEWMTNPQTADLSGLAILWGMNHLRVQQVDDFDRLETGEKTLLLEIVPDPAQTTAFWAAWDKKWCWIS